MRRNISDVVQKIVNVMTALPAGSAEQAVEEAFAVPVHQSAPQVADNTLRKNLHEFIRQIQSSIAQLMDHHQEISAQIYPRSSRDSRVSSRSKKQRTGPPKRSAQP